jgi:hypothetical protein
MALALQSFAGNMPPPRGSLKPLLCFMAGMGAYGVSRGVRSVMEVGETTPHVLVTHGLANGIMYASPATIVPSFCALLRRIEVDMLMGEEDHPPTWHHAAYYEWNGLMCSSTL